MDLILTEKPSAARAIVEALGGFRTRQGYYESRDWLLTWAVGHLAELCEPQDYHPALAKWRLETLPIIPAFRLRPAAGAAERLGIIGRLAGRAAGLVNACDAAREGELIFRQITEILGLELPARRLWVSSLTKEAIRRGFAELRPSSEYDRLFRSAECRARGDWLIGINATRAFSCKAGGVYSVGRVQTPTLAMIVAREAEAASFAARDFWEVLAEFTSPEAGRYEGRWFKGEEKRFFDRTAAEAVCARTAGQPGRVAEATTKEERENPPLLFDLTSLQREANRRWGMTASATLAAAQRLYEAKLITYPRTDSRFLTPDVARTTRTIIDGLAEQAGLAVWCRGADPAAIHGHGRVINPGRVADHHAIIPTGERPGALSPSDAKVYGLIAGRFLAQFYPPAVDRVRRVMTTVGIDDFETVGRVTMVEGWRVVELGEQARGDRRRGDKRRGEEDGGGLSSLDGLSVGDEVLCTEARLKDGRTEPPPRYTEGSLLAAMETAGRHVDDEALREAMKGRGLGTPATRAAIIDRLKRVGYVEVAARRLRPTAKGIQLIEAARAAGAEVLLSPQLTGEWEQRINAVQTAEVDPARFMGEIEGLTGALVEKVKGWSTGPRAAVGGDPGGAAGPPPTLKCPLCGRGVTLVRGRWVCAGNESDCRFRVGAWILGRRIESADLAELCQKGRTRLLTGFRSRNGRRFAARLVAGPAGVTFEFARHRGKSGPPAKLAPQNEGSAKVAQKARGNTRRKTSARATKPRRTAE